MEILTPLEMLEAIDQLIESLDSYEECYECMDLIYSLKEQVTDSFEL